MKDVKNKLVEVAQAVGGLIDAGVPVGVNSRTKYAVVAAAAAPVIAKIVCMFYPPACAPIQELGVAASMLAPVFGFAGLVRADPAPAK
jgi:hypothetical protein